MTAASFTSASLPAKRVLVTGGAGFIGSHLVDALAKGSPPALVVVDNFFLGKHENLAQARQTYPDLVVEKTDVSDAEALRTVVERHGIEVVFDLATVPLPYSLEFPAATIHENVGMAINVSELARSGLIETLVHASTSEVYGTAITVPMAEDHPLVPRTPYAASKAAADHIVASYVATFGIDAAVIRPFNNYGPRQNEGSYAGLIPLTIRRALAGEPILVHGDGEQTRDFIFVTDTIAGILAAYEERGTRGAVVNLASGVEVSVNTVVGHIVDALEVEATVRHVEPRPGDVRRHAGSNGLARRLLGFQPSIPLAEGMAETVAWYLRVLEGTGP